MTATRTGQAERQATPSGRPRNVGRRATVRLRPDNPADQGLDPNESADQLEALEQIYGRVARYLRHRLDSSRSDVREIAFYGRHYSWISDRHRMVRTMLHSEPVVRAYVCAESARADRLGLLIASADEVSRRPTTLPTVLAVLEYIDHELGWALPAKAA